MIIESYRFSNVWIMEQGSVATDAHGSHVTQQLLFETCVHYYPSIVNVATSGTVSTFSLSSPAYHRLRYSAILMGMPISEFPVYTNPLI